MKKLKEAPEKKLFFSIKINVRGQPSYSKPPGTHPAHPVHEEGKVPTWALILLESAGINLGRRLGLKNQLFVRLNVSMSNYCNWQKVSICIFPVRDGSMSNCNWQKVSICIFLFEMFLWATATDRRCLSVFFPFVMFLWASRLRLSRAFFRNRIIRIICG